MSTPQPSRRQLLGGLLAGLTGWLFASQGKAAPTTPAPTPVPSQGITTFVYDSQPFLSNCMTVTVYDSQGDRVAETTSLRSMTTYTYNGTDHIP